MAKFVKGDIVVIPFPFSDLTCTKRRPALVLTQLAGDDVILCQITSQNISDEYAISINDSDFERGRLNRPSNVRSNRIFTVDSHIILYQVGTLKSEKLLEIVAKVVSIIRG